MLRGRDDSGGGERLRFVASHGCHAQQVRDIWKYHTHAHQYDDQECLPDGLVFLTALFIIT